MTWRLLLCWPLLTGFAGEPKVYADLSVPKVEVNYAYSGAELLVYGAVQYPVGKAPEGAPRLAVIARGPDEAITVRRKERLAGIWVNASSERFLTAPAYVWIATSAPLDTLVDERTASIWEMDFKYLQFSPYGGEDPSETAEFVRGLIDLRERAGLYRSEARGVTVTENILYRSRIFIPPSAPVGSYSVTVLLIREGEVVATANRTMTVEKAGVEARISRFAETQSLLYGLATVALAVGAGWLGSLVTRQK